MTVQALRERRIDTLAGLLDAYGREIQGVAYLILRDRALAEDVTIETLLTAFERGGSIREESAVRPWLLRVAANKALSVRRSGARVIHLAVLPDSMHPGDLASDTSDRVVLRYYADLSVEGVAAALGKSPNTIKAQLKTALDRMRRTLSEPAIRSGETSRA